MLDVLVLTPQRLVYEGKAQSVILPGEKGVFEILAHHKRLLSQLLRGFIFVDEKKMRIKRGVAKVGLNQVMIIVEEEDS